MGKRNRGYSGVESLGDLWDLGVDLLGSPQGEDEPLYSNPASAAMAGRELMPDKPDIPLFHPGHSLAAGESGLAARQASRASAIPQAASDEFWAPMRQAAENLVAPSTTRVLPGSPGEPADVPAPTVMPAQQYDTDLPLPDPEPMDALPEPPFDDFDFPETDESDLLPLVPPGHEALGGQGEISPTVVNAPLDPRTQGFTGDVRPSLTPDEILDMGDDDSQFMDLASGQGYAKFGNGPGIAVDGDQFTTADGQGGALPDPFGFGTAERRAQPEPRVAQYARVLENAAQGVIPDHDALREAVTYQGAINQAQALKRRGIPVSKADENFMIAQAMEGLNRVRMQEQAAVQAEQNKVLEKERATAEKQQTEAEKMRAKAISDRLTLREKELRELGDEADPRLIERLQDEIMGLRAEKYGEVDAVREFMATRPPDVQAIVPMFGGERELLIAAKKQLQKTPQLGSIEAAIVDVLGKALGGGARRAIQ